MTYIVDARNGRILERWSNRHTAAATGTARTLYSGDVALSTNSITGGYEMRDLLRGKGYTIDASNSRTSARSTRTPTTSGATTPSPTRPRWLPTPSTARR